MASSAFNSSITMNGKEPQFYKRIKDYILSLSDRITCSEDPDDEFDYSTKGDSHIATLNFSIDGTHVFKLYRPDVLRSSGSEVAVKSIVFSMDLATGIPEGTTTLNFKSSSITSSITQSTVHERGLRISHIVNDSFVYFIFSCLTTNIDLWGTETCKMIHTKSDSNVFATASQYAGTTSYTKSDLFNLSGFTLYDKSLVIPQGTFLSRFTYAAPPGEIDYIKSAVYLNGGSKAFENKAIYDSTTVNVGDTVSLKDGSYVAIGSHQLVKCS